MKDTLLPVTVERDASVVSLTFAQSTTNQLETLAGVDLHGVNLRGSDLNGVDLRNANLMGADLKGANLSGADLRGATLSNADLRGATLNRAMLSGATLNRADLRGADLSNTILSGANLWDANLNGASLDRANLWDANLSGASLSGADIKGAILSSANLRSANLSRANLWGTNLTGANLHRANLACVDLSSADLSNANLLEANLSQADLSSAIVENTRFGKNQGLMAAAELDLQQRGALFTTSGERKYSGASRFESKNSISQPGTSKESYLPKIAPVSQVLLSQETSSDKDNTPDSFDFGQLDRHSAIDLPPSSPAWVVSSPVASSPVVSSPIEPTPVKNSLVTATPLSYDELFPSGSDQFLSSIPEHPLSSDHSLPPTLPLEFPISEGFDDRNRQEISGFNSLAESKDEVVKPDPTGYVSPIARTAAAIRSRRARVQSKTNKHGLNSSLSSSNYLI